MKKKLIREKAQILSGDRNNSSEKNAILEFEKQYKKLT